MQALDSDMLCPECSRRFLDAGDELVCPGCGVVGEKQVIEAPLVARPRPRDAVRPPLGSYMGPRFASAGERTARGITGEGDGYRYLKAVSDFAGRREGAAMGCARLIERVGEKLGLPHAVLLEAASTANKVLTSARSATRRTSVAPVSAYSLISACRTAGMTAVSPREILATHAALGRRVSSSSVIQLAIDSPVRTYASGPDGYLSRVIGRLLADRRLSERLAKDGVHMAGYLVALRECAAKILALAERTEMSGKRPCALAAAAVYSAETVLSACEGRDRRLTQRELAQCGDTSEYTVRDQCAVIFLPVVRELIARRMPALPPQAVP
jgi:transcription initiation factor TFIIIB Brf1 subunit/transcription initiation factor TFIIB